MLTVSDLGHLNKYMGERIRKRRKALGLTQGELGARVGVRHQQVHKHEVGESGLGLGRLMLYAQALDVKHLGGLNYFVDGYIPVETQAAA